MFSCIRRVEKGVNRIQRVCGLKTMISTIIMIMVLQWYCKVANIRKQGTVAEVTSKLKSSISSDVIVHVHICAISC